MIFLYYCCFALALCLLGPLLLVCKRKARFGLAEKLGFVPQRITPKNSGNKRIWFHTVSVGEFNATYPLLLRFRNEYPEYEIYVSTTTGTGQQLANEKVGDWATVFYFPYDLPWAAGSWLDRVQPNIVAIAETEIWPGFTHQCEQRGIDLVFINARISPRSFRQYKALKAMFGPVIRRFVAIAAQSEAEADRYRALGAGEDVVEVCGNMKFDGLKAISDDERLALRNKLHLGADDFVLVGGSTHEGEESALLDTLRTLGGNARLILAPRHPERFQRVYQIVESYGYRVRSFVRGEAFERENDVYVLDTIGQLVNHYSIASVAFVGGTIAPIGGHNLAEPCLYEVPVICGPHVEKTRDVARILLERGAMVQVSDKQELAGAILDLMKQAPLRKSMGMSGKKFLEDSQGAVERTLKLLGRVLPKEAKDNVKVESDRELVS